MSLTPRYVLCAALPAVLLSATATAALGQTPSLEEQLRQPVNSSSLSQSRDIADQLLRLGQQLATAGQYESAVRAWERAAELYYDVGDRLGMGESYENLAIAYARLGQYAAAETAARRYLGVARDNASFQDQARAWNTLGTLLLQRGDLGGAARAFEEGLAVAQSVQNYALMGLSLTNLGLVARTGGDYAAAIDYYQAAGNLRNRVGDQLGQASTNANLGDVYRANGELGRALGAYRLALRLSSDLADPQRTRTVQIQALNGLIETYTSRSEWSAVRDYLDERIALTASLDDPFQQLVTLRYLGIYYAAINNLEEARTAYQQALGLARVLEEKQLEGDLTNRLLQVSSALQN